MGINEIYKNYNKLLSEKNRHDNFQCSGKFNILQQNFNQQISNGGNDNNDNICNNNAGGTITKNEYGFVSFKFFNNNNLEKKMTVKMIKIINKIQKEMKIYYRKILKIFILMINKQ